MAASADNSPQDDAQVTDTQESAADSAELLPLERSGLAGEQSSGEGAQDPALAGSTEQNATATEGTPAQPGVAPRPQSNRTQLQDGAQSASLHENSRSTEVATRSGQGGVLAGTATTPVAGPVDRWDAQGSWQRAGDSWWWRNPDGSWPVSQWGTVGGRHYYADATGYLHTGWLHDADTWYFFDPDGTMHTGWLQDAGHWYYLQADGSMKLWTLTLGEDSYFFNRSGQMMTGWVSYSDGWRYYLPSGRRASGWQRIGHQWYAFIPASGLMRTGWIQDGTTWYYLNRDGSMHTGWLQDAGHWYYLRTNGSMAVWTLPLSSGTYFFNRSGQMMTGWVKHPDGWRYYQSSGARLSGWYREGNRWYYLDPSTGLMATGQRTIDGRTYTFPLYVGGSQSTNSSGGFNPGAIISDAEMFDGAGMSESEIRSFLQQKNSRCVAGPDGSPCLKDYRTATSTLTSSVCSTYVGAGSEDVATMIAKSSRACGVNPKVLLVILQKEQGLVLASGRGLTSRAYLHATGFGCPDGSGCSAAFAGLHSQIYYAASQLRLYGERPQSYRYRAGQTAYIAYHPRSSCGGTQVTISNRATAALYNYTPYQPNAAALANMRGTGDSCSTYGNRNFWRYYLDWFGSTGV